MFMGPFKIPNIYLTNQAGFMLTDSGRSHWQINEPLSQAIDKPPTGLAGHASPEDCQLIWMVFPKQWKKGSGK